MLLIHSLPRANRAEFSNPGTAWHRQSSTKAATGMASIESPPPPPTTPITPAATKPPAAHPLRFRLGSLEAWRAALLASLGYGAPAEATRRRHCPGSCSASAIDRSRAPSGSGNAITASSIVQSPRATSRVSAASGNRPRRPATSARATHNARAMPSACRPGSCERRSRPADPYPRGSATPSSRARSPGTPAEPPPTAAGKPSNTTQPQTYAARSAPSSTPP